MRGLLSFLLLICSLIAHGMDNSSLDVDASTNCFVVRLDANPTTGYQWSVLQYDKERFTLSRADYQKPQTNLIGAGGVMQFRFCLNQGKTYPKKTQMLFQYARSWDPKSATLKSLMLHFIRE